ncbi:MAG: PAS domain S-box protein [Pseudomonadota bacterium]
MTDQADVLESAAFSWAVLNSMAAEIAVLSRDGTILAVNTAWRRFALENGIEPRIPAPGTDVGANYLAVCQPVAGIGLDGADDARDGVRAVLDGRLPSFNLEYPCHSPQEQRWFNLSVTPLGEAALDGVVITHTNITKRIKIAQELNNVLAALDQHAIVATTDVQGRITSANDKLCETSGYSREELLGQDFRVLNSGLHPKEFFRGIYQTVSAGHAWHGEVRNRAKDGHFSWAQTTIVPFMDGAGAHLKNVVIRTDITQRKVAEFELQLHRDHLKELVQKKTADLLQSVEQKNRALAELRQQKFVLDQHASVTITDVAGRITYANDKFCEICGYSREEVMGQDHHFLNSGYHPKGFFQTMYETINRGEVWHAEVCNRAKDGHLYWVEATFAAFMGEDGKPQEYIGIRTDISERKRAEEVALAANRAKSAFLANMSHEIRTPMNGVVGMVDILQQTELNPTQHRMLETIHNSSQVLLSILNDILDFSKIEAGKLSVEYLPTRLREVAEDVALLVMTSSSAHSVDLFVFVAPELPRWILIDPTRLRQVLMNLLSNALKFTPPKANYGARVIVTLGPSTLADGRPGVMLQVADNGIGMSLQEQTMLFQPFTQADESTARKFGGTGLGLSITLRLVQLMGGQISVRSKLGEGSQFFVELPLQAAPPTQRDDPEPELSDVHVLLASRDAVMRQIVASYCSAMGAQCSAVADLDAARQQLQPSRLAVGPIVVLIDPDITTGADQLGLPADVGVVRLVRRNADKLTDEITVPARPIFYRDLLQGLARACGRSLTPSASRPAERPHLPSIQAPSVEDAGRTGRLILLAEDNEISRDVLKEQLRLLGYAAEVAVDGLEALEMWRTGRFALLLTDCHMPNMDGFELTRVIRESEPQGTRLPIVAITANALPGEAQRCQARGMDDYLSKPLRLKELGPMLAKWLPLADETPDEAADTAFPVWDATMLGQLVGDNPAMHRRLLEKFLINANEQVAAIGLAIAAGECSDVADVAHTLKSAARSVGAMALGELCQALETAGRAHDGPTCTALAEGLKLAFSGAEEKIKNYVIKLSAD